MNGRVELMINRRLFKDDNRGVVEPLNENNAYGNPVTINTNIKVQLQ